MHHASWAARAIESIVLSMSAPGDVERVPRVSALESEHNHPPELLSHAYAEFHTATTAATPPHPKTKPALALVAGGSSALLMPTANKGPLLRSLLPKLP
ncbi:hypothetical protein EVG20_g4775 [Dentipellis fragilis]|uniref:Uncharacterized protein n=1 Tax=Dentipellis fragilis TaxID=205917 RepID=A0A4Y9YXL4_9AGAM|nr:hypothetical protein EVG20_g4775 [Dentipellis fragilis]